MPDLDQGGVFQETTRIYLGPSLGWRQGVAPAVGAITVVSAGTTVVQPGISLVHVNVNGSVIVQLYAAKGNATGGAGAVPGSWVQPVVTVNDSGGFAQANPITIMPAVGETIGGASFVTIGANNGLFTMIGDVQNGGWTVLSGTSGTALTDAPNDGSAYGRQSAAWAKVLPLAGGTMTGALVLNADPAVALGAATKQYVDTHPGEAPSDGNYYTRRNAAWANGAGVFVRYDTAQGLSVANQRQAQSNVFIAPTTQVFTTGSGTYTTPAGCLWIEVEMVGGGGGGAGSGTSPGAVGSAAASTFSTLSAGAGGAASGSAGGAGGTASGGYLNKTGVNGGNGSGVNATRGGAGGNSPLGGAGAGGAAGGGAGVASAPNSGSGGGGAGVNVTPNGGGGGGAAGYLKAIIASPAATYAYAVGAGGAGGTLGTGGAAGANGGSGLIVVKEFYGS